MSFGGRALSALGKVGIALSVTIVFLFGFVGTVYLSLRTSEVKVPDVLGKDRFTAEGMLNDVGLNIRIRGTRPSTDTKPDTILSQMPEAGQVVKAGIPVAVEVSRVPKEGESVVSGPEEQEQQEQQQTDKPADNANANQPSATNQNQNQNKPKNKNKNSNNKNSNNSNNANRNSNNRNANSGANRNSNKSPNSNANATPNANRGNLNVNKRPPVTSPPAATGVNKATP